jgi:hypothetical protein
MSNPNDRIKEAKIKALFERGKKQYGKKINCVDRNFCYRYFIDAGGFIRSRDR